MSIKALPARGIYGWDATNETWVKVKVDSTGKITITSTDLTTILSEIQHATYGLSAIETLVDSIETTLASPDTFKADVSALALEATLTAIKGTSWSDETLKAIKDALEDAMQRATSPSFDQDTDSLEAISEAIATIETALEATNFWYKARAGFLTVPS